MARASEIPERDLEISFVRATGPGGQNVNKVSSAAQLRFNLAGTMMLDAAAKARLAVLAGQRLNADGWIQIIARTQRTQEGNRREGMARLRAMIAQARIAPKKRAVVQDRPLGLNLPGRSGRSLVKESGFGSRAE